VDSFFWGRWTWPEFEALVFNVVQGKSEEWGVSLLVVGFPWFRIF
jgi:alpha-1,6-mannosyltransferase